MAQYTSSRIHTVLEGRELEEMLKKNSRFETTWKLLLQLCNAISRTESLEQFLGYVDTTLNRVVDTDNITIGLVHPETQGLYFPYYRDEKNPDPPSRSHPDRDFLLASDMVRTGEPLLLDEEAMLRYRPLQHSGLNNGSLPKIWLGIPLTRQNGVIGAVLLKSYSDPFCYTGKEMDFLMSISRQLATSIDHKQKEEQLKRSREHYHALFESSPLGIMKIDECGIILDCNERCTEILGSSKSQLAGDKFQERFSAVSPEHLQRAIEGVPSKFEETVRSQNLGNDTILRLSLRPVSSRTPSAVIATLEDMTERRHTEETVKASAEQIRAFFSSINDAVFVHPLQQEGFGKIIEVNDIACRRYGYTREEFMEMTPMDITDLNDARDHARRRHRKKLLKNGQLIFEAVHIKKSGERFPVEINANVTRQYGQPVILAVARDISDRVAAQSEKKLLENRILQMQKLESIGRLAGGVAHDFNNMLSIILGHAEILLDTMVEESPMYDDIRKIEEAALHSAQLTKQLLAFARKQSIEPRTLDINGEIERMLNMIGRLIGEDIRLLWHPADNPWPVLFDPSQMDQIITNLCINGRDAIAGIGTIVISTANRQISGDASASMPGLKSGDYVEISVKDSGAGISDCDLPHIFEPFFTTKATGQGTGLGLSTVYGILKQNSGNIYVESNSSGTEFLVYIPRGTDQAVEDSAALSPSPAAAGSGNILVVEDEEKILSLVRSMLIRSGFTVISSQSPLDAVRKAEEFEDNLHLLLTDVVMPGMNGSELARRLRQSQPGMHCLFMSGYPADTLAGLGSAGDDLHFIQKPFSKNDLLHKIFSILRQNEAHGDGISPLNYP